MTSPASGPQATAQLATIAATMRADVGRERAREESELNWDAIREHEAEERAFDRSHRPLTLAEWAKREEGDL